MNRKVGAAADAAQAAVWQMIRDHQAAAIPSLIGACVLWAVEYGGADVVRGSLQNAIRLSHEMEAAHRKAQQ